MAKLVSNTPDVPPWHIWTSPFRFLPEPNSGFADDLQFALDGGNDHRIRAERFEIHAGRELVDHRNCVRYVTEPALG
jgi:hypothetical protein